MFVRGILLPGWSGVLRKNKCVSLPQATTHAPPSHCALLLPKHRQKRPLCRTGRSPGADRAEMLGVILNGLLTKIQDDQNVKAILRHRVFQEQLQQKRADAETA